VWSDGAAYRRAVSRPWRAQVERLNRWETDLVERRMHLPPTPPYALFLAVDALATGSRLWFAVAAVLAARPGRPRRAARDGALAAAAAASCTQLLNRIVARPRPVADLPARRALRHQPTAPSFPSSHSAVAAAFCTAVRHRSPGVAAALAPLAGTIAYHRVRTRAHWPTDVLGGVVLGILVGELVARATS
jgi:membrane-associated phospholipid phosphatase